MPKYRSTYHAHMRCCSAFEEGKYRLHLGQRRKSFHRRGKRESPKGCVPPPSSPFLSIYRRPQRDSSGSMPGRRGRTLGLGPIVFCASARCRVGNGDTFEDRFWWIDPGLGCLHVYLGGMTKRVMGIPCPVPAILVNWEDCSGAMGILRWCKVKFLRATREPCGYEEMLRRGCCCRR